MVWETRKNYFNIFNVRNTTDNKQFWKTVKPLFLCKVGDNEMITLIEEDKVISEDGEVAKKFKSYFENILESLDVNSNLCLRSL